MQSTILLSVVLLDLFLMAREGKCAKPQVSAAIEHRLAMKERAILNSNLMNTIGTCRVPRPQIIYPKKSNNKLYYPRGTILHRCTDQTGCCPNDGEVCRPDIIVEVEKVFFVNHLVINGQKPMTGQRITPRLKAPKQNFTTLTESITFLNHTSCFCVKLAPNSIEHDELQSVVSRPLVAKSTLDSGTFLYHIMIGSVALIALLMVLFFAYKCIVPSYTMVRQDPDRRNSHL